ncbi:MAG: hypothetical protein ABS44_14205 [Chryseobacterium sp. SCN 40-13]|nr:MAG: hypothetical protein ABS44_14205 [Chryseobacterium sp. SCN 40-13]
MILRRDNVLVGQELEIIKPKDHHTAEKSSRSFPPTGVYLSVFIYLFRSDDFPIHYWLFKPNEMLVIKPTKPKFHYLKVKYSGRFSW